MINLNFKRKYTFQKGVNAILQIFHVLEIHEKYYRTVDFLGVDFC